MLKRIFFGIILALYILNISTSALNTQYAGQYYYCTVNRESPARTWTVDDDGPADFATIQEAINAADPGDTVYVHNGTYNGHVLVNKALSLIGEDKHTTIIDGGGKTVVSLKANNTIISRFTVQNGPHGILMYPWTHGHTMKGNVILNNEYGVSGHYDCSNVIIDDNIIALNNVTGIEMLFSHSVISNNLICDNGMGEFQEYSSGIQIVKGVNSKVIYCVNNTILCNTIKNHQTGIWAIHYSEKNRFFHNNFINNTIQVHSVVSDDSWDDGYPLGGNYWSDYKGRDLRSGSSQNRTGRDGIGDTPYFINDNNRDNYPLMKPWGPMKTVFNITWNEKVYSVAVVSNSTVTGFNFSQLLKRMSFNVSGPDGSTGFCNITMPNVLLRCESPEEWRINIDDAPITAFVVTENETHTNLYFTYTHTVHQVQIVGTKVIGEEERTLLGTGWGWMRIAHNENVYGRAELYEIGNAQIELLITYQGKEHFRTWNIIRRREHRHHQIYFCSSREHRILNVGIHHTRWTFWCAVGKDTIAFGFPKTWNV